MRLCGLAASGLVTLDTRQQRMTPWGLQPNWPDAGDALPWQLQPETR
jgi:hypothetical protein